MVVLISLASVALFTGPGIIGMSKLLEELQCRLKCRHKQCAHNLPQLSPLEKRTLSMLIDDFEITLRRYKRMHSMEQRKAGLHELREVYKAAPDAQDPVVVLQLLRQYVYNRTEQLSAA